MALQSDGCSDKTDRDLVQQAPSARLVLPPFQIDSNMLQEMNEKKSQKLGLIKCSWRWNDWEKALT